VKTVCRVADDREAPAHHLCGGDQAQGKCIAWTRRHEAPQARTELLGERGEKTVVIQGQEVLAAVGIHAPDEPAMVAVHGEQCQRAGGGESLVGDAVVVTARFDPGGDRELAIVAFVYRYAELLAQRRMTAVAKHHELRSHPGGQIFDRLIAGCGDAQLCLGGIVPGHCIHRGRAQDAHALAGAQRGFQRLSQIPRGDDITQCIHRIVLGTQAGETEMAAIGHVDAGNWCDGCG
jgi:hypothetical protein